MTDENEQGQAPQDQDKQDPSEQEQKPEATNAESLKPQDETVAEVKATLKGLGLQDKMILFGSLALVVLFLLPWWSMSTNFMGVKQSNSINGLHDVAWLGWVAAIVATALSLTQAGILKAMPPALVSASKNTGVFVALTGWALLAGPIYFWINVGGDVPAELERAGALSAGKTFFFFLALLAALAAAGGAAWKLMEERRAAAGGDDV